ncbi:MAG TPA: Nudix family hydrolase [Rhodocyclaceae bacterium]|nr:Nudix family hydrolase [Rhodocyclaceae bacterium]
MTGIVEVAAAVILRNNGEEFLLAQRPEGKVYAGYWEFPGGKVEPGETVREALVRELQEELGITATAATPWLTRQFTYPHATVRLNFWRVTAWEGEIGVTAPLEHSAVEWMRCDEAATVAPILPANDPILKALSLPVVMAITNMEDNGEDAELSRLEGAINKGLRLFQIRDKGLPGAERAWFAQAAAEMVRNSDALVLVNDDPALAHRIHASGVHLSAAASRYRQSRPEASEVGKWVGASCHNEAELKHANDLGLDYALLGPVLPTATHPGMDHLGWINFERMVAGSAIPVFALGGLSMDMLETAQAHGAHGIALMRNWP